MADETKSRSCLPCTACCTSLEVVEFNKPAGVPCVHLTPTGCGIYTDPKKPAICNTFRCGWLEGYGEKNERPDKSGVILRTGQATEGPLAGTPFAQAHEVSKGSVELRPARKVLNKLAKQLTVVLIRLNGKRTFWPAPDR
jgi:hypothetical protein